MIQILEVNDDVYRFERAWIGSADEALEARCLMSGIECRIGDKPGPLADGLAFVQPVDPHLCVDWPIYTRIRRIEFPGDPPEEVLLYNFTANPRVVAAGRRFLELLEEGKAKAGMEL